MYRPPEVIIGGDFSDKADVWSAACILWHVACKRQMFPSPEPKKGDKAPDKNANQLAEIIGLLGPVPQNIEGRRRRKYFDEFGQLRAPQPVQRPRMVPYLKYKCGMADDEAVGFANFMKGMVIMDPSKRHSIHQALQHEWLQDLESYT